MMFFQNVPKFETEMDKTNLKGITSFLKKKMFQYRWLFQSKFCTIRKSIFPPNSTHFCYLRVIYLNNLKITYKT